ncbi:MAG: DUF932 domain-containing protein [Thermoplasmata archaeon]|jgi:hypothetical protein
MIASNPTESQNLRRPYETVVTPDQVPLYDLVPVHGPQGEPLEAYRGVRRKDTSQVVSIVSDRYQLVQHREVAEAVHAIGEALERPVLDANAPVFPREQIRLFAGGRRMEVRLVVGTRYELAPGESVYPGVRVMNSLDGSWAVRAEGTGVRIACANQLYAGMHSLVELREVHLSSETDLMAMLQKAIHTILGRFRDALQVYADAMGDEVLAEDVTPLLIAAGLPRVYATTIGARAEAAASHNALLTRWSAYQVATEILTHEVGPRVSPERSRGFERAAASALLISDAATAPA